MTKSQRTTGWGRGRGALLLGLAGFGIALFALAGAPAIAAPASPARPSLRAAPASPASILPGPVLGKPPVIGGGPCGTASVPLVITGYTTTATTVPTGSAVSLTVTVSCNIAPTPYWVQIFDTTTGAPVASCYLGTTCTATVSQSAASTHNYIAYLDQHSSTYPPASVDQEATNIYVTWEAPPNSFSIWLSGPTGIVPGEGPVTYTAYVNQNVGPTPYYIEIFDETTGQRLAICATGTQCSASYTPPSWGPAHDLVAFVSASSTALPPAATQASSNVLVAVVPLIAQ